MSNLLYFPFINLPKSEWTMHSLLYYENISSIVPDEFFYAPEENYEPFMLELVRENLVTPLNPMQELNDPYSLVDPFMTFIQSPYYKIQRKRDLFNDQINSRYINSQKFSPTNINRQKFNYELLYNLEQLGLARRSEGEWYQVENYTAGYLMSYLSNVLANKLNLLPITDKPLNLPFYMRYNKIGTDSEVRIRRENVLKSVIPYPLEINISKLMQLKQKYNSELIALRSVVEQIALDSRYDNEELLGEKIKELNYNKEQLSARFRESRLGEIAFGSIFGLVGAVYGFAQTNNTSGAIIGGFTGFANAVYSALRIEDPTNIYDPSGMKYLALIDSKLRK